MTEARDVRLPADLCTAAESKYGQTFASVEDLLTFILRDLLRDDAARFDQAEEQMIENRLRDLGYL
jgi:hypothetical protein